MVRITLLDKAMLSIPIPVSVKYGLHYNSHAITDARNINAEGWDVPTNTNYGTLITYLSSTGFQLKVKDNNATYWNDITNVTNITNFSARGGGYRNNTTGAFVGIKQNGDLICLISGDYARLTLTSGSSDSQGITASIPDNYGLPLRLLRNATIPEQLATDGTAMNTYIGNDLKQYPTVKIGTQVWLACNLAETKYRTGAAIPEVTDNTAWSALTTGAMCAYNNDWSNVLL